jgi:hypothetical protein
MLAPAQTIKPITIMIVRKISIERLDSSFQQANYLPTQAEHSQAAGAVADGK